MRDVLVDWERLSENGLAVGRAVVTRVWGSAPRGAGACLLANSKGEFAGSVSGGCIEGAAVQEIVAAIERGQPRSIRYDVSNKQAWNVGLACGGTIEILVEPTVRPELVAAAQGPGGVVFATIVSPSALMGWTWVVNDDGTVSDALPPAGTGERAITPPELAGLESNVARLADSVTVSDRSVVHTWEQPDGNIEMFFELIARQPRLVIFGGVHIAIPLVPMAQQLGYQVVVTDAREGFLTRERFPTADRLEHGWPTDTLADIGLDRGTSVVVLTHDPKLDDPALEIALRSSARYVGALGSRKTQAARRARLKSAGLEANQLARLHGPVGLDLGGRDPAETALAILAEMTAVRYGRAARQPMEEDS